MTMADTRILEHAEKHLDRIKFPTNQGGMYILERGKYTKMAYSKLQKNWQNAEDAVQECYRTLLEYPSCASFQELEDFEAYFTCVLNGVISRMYRTDKAQEKHNVTPSGKYVQYLEVDINEQDDKQLEIVALPDELSDPAATFLAGEMLGKIKHEIGRLPFNARNVVALNVLYQYKPREIVEITGLSVANVYSHIKRFRARMEERIK